MLGTIVETWPYPAYTFKSESQTMTIGEVQPGSAANALHERSTSLRRARPPNIDLAQNENRVPLRTEKSMKRDSKIGLRGIFTRSKAGKTDKDFEDSSRTSRPPGIRASLAEFGNWPYRLHSSRSEASLVNPLAVDPRSTAADLSAPYSSRGNFSTDRLQPTVPLRGRAVTKPWNPPPLFQVYPQAVKHATLPVCNVPIEVLARYGETRSGNLINEPGIRSSEHGNDSTLRIKGDTLKKRQRLASLRNASEWTSKIFVLVTSGYLLQYAAEGTFNRVPEKILQLTATSAAYASDLIPGRHWVLQVASITDAEGNTFMNHKSRRPKLSMRDSRHVSNMLLVFESAESMDSWLAVLRREIELQGGKRKMSETGKMEVDDLATETEVHSNQRTIVFKDHDRFSRIIPRDFYVSENTLVDLAENGLAISSPQRTSIYTIDNASPTASMISSDGQRLDNLRDSSSSHRFSYVSSGQRTMVTSEGSSPACSPTRASFSSQGEDIMPLPSLPEVRLRPNAAAIVNRRQSMQTLISSFEAPLEQTSRPYTSSIVALGSEAEQINGLSVPNFSVPHAANKRFSLNASVSNVASYYPQTIENERNNKLSRKPPPTALLMSRPLSIVIDQPSPRSPCSPNSLSKSVDSFQSATHEPKYAASILGSSPERSPLDQTHSPGNSAQSQPSQPCSSTREAAGAICDQTSPTFGVDYHAGVDDNRVGEHIPRAASSLGSYGTRRRLSGISRNKDSLHKRSSLISESRSYQNLPLSSTNMDNSKPILVDSKINPMAKSTCSPKRSAPSLRAPPQYPAIDSQERSVTARKSMPHLNEGPPLAPPPNCALPPIPRKPSGGYHIINA
ncbi:hypothetical protein F5Y07DRAFT_370542 [Xylaria sp. FL0933]|nr:hypothetical protein F5Y07DRAFT_370542 [Xylaria sp. FL0933]